MNINTHLNLFNLSQLIFQHLRVLASVQKFSDDKWASVGLKESWKMRFESDEIYFIAWQSLNNNFST